MQTRIVNGYEIVGNRYIAIIVAKHAAKNYKCFEHDAWKGINAFVMALFWVDPTLKDAAYTAWDEPFHTLLDVSNDPRCAYPITTLKERVRDCSTLEEAVSNA